MAGPEKTPGSIRSTPEAWRKYQRDYMRKRRLDPAIRAKESKKTRKWQLAHPLEFALSNTKKGAKNRGVKWALNDRHALDLITDNCLYCGSVPDSTNGIDRVDNLQGYVEDNVVTACRRCNRAKHTQTLPEFLNQVERVAGRLDMLANLR